MFKGLKSKIAEETKKIQNAVTQVAGDGLSSFSLGGKSGNDVSHANGSERSQGTSGANDSGLLVDIPLPNDESDVKSPEMSSQFVSANSSFASFFDVDNSSTMMAEGERTPTRQRHDSISSVGSLDSNISYLMPSQGGFSSGANRLGVITSDLETDTESAAGSTFLSGASKEQISSVLNRLHGRAANYKDKYRQLAKMYNEMIKENDKIRTILTTTQDKALRRIQELREEKRMQEKAKRDLEENLQTKLSIKDKMVESLQEQMKLLKEGKPVDDAAFSTQDAEKGRPAELVAHKERVKKLEELLSRCKDSMKVYKERLETLSTENEELKQRMSNLEQEEGNTAISDFVNDRVAAQFKSQMQDAEREWNQKLTEIEERTAMAVAQAKQDMHVELEKKDQVIESLREKLKTLESSASSEVEDLQERLEKAEKAENILEDEKRDLVQQLSQAKQAIVKIVQEEENAKRQKLEEDWQRKLDELEHNYELKLQQIEEDCGVKMTEKTKEYNIKLREYEEQSQLAIEERELQKSAVATKYDERVDQLLSEIEQLKTDKLEQASTYERTIEELSSKIATLTESLENTNSVNVSEIDRFNLELNQLRSELSQKDAELIDASRKVTQLENSLAAVEEQKNVDTETYTNRLSILEQTVKEETSKIQTTIGEYEAKLKELSSERDEQLKVATKEHEMVLQKMRQEFEQEITKKEEEWRIQQSDSADEKSNQLLAIIDQLRQEKSDIQNDRNQRIAEMDKKLSDLQTFLDDELKRHTLIIEQLDVQKKQLADELQAKNENLATTLQELEQLNASNAAAQETWIERFREVNNTMEEYNVQIQDLQNSLAQEREQRKKLEEEYEKKLEQLHGEYQMKMMENEEDWKMRQNKIEKERVDELLAEIEELKTNRSELQTKYEAEIASLNSRITELSTLLDSANADNISEIGRFASENAALLSDIKRLENELIQVKENSAIEKVNYENALAEAEIKFKKEFDQLRNENASNNALIVEEANSKIKAMEAQHEEQVDALTRDLQVELERKQEDWRMSMEERRAALKLEIDELRKEKSQLEYSLSDQLQNSSLKISELNSIIENDGQRYKSEIDRLISETAALQSALMAKDEQLKAALDEALRESTKFEEMEEKFNKKLQEEQNLFKNAQEEALRIRNDYEMNRRDLMAKHEDEIRRLRMDLQVEVDRKEEELRLRKNADEESVGALLKEIEQLKEAKTNLQMKLDQTISEFESKLSALTEQMQNDNDLRSVEVEGIRMENAALTADISRKDDQLKSAIKELEKQTARHDQLMKLAQDEWMEKAKDYESRIAVLERNANDEIEVQLKTAVAEHNEKVKQLCRDFQLEMSKKENEWQTELNSAYARAEEDRHRGVREYQKEAKQLHQELQEKSKRLSELKSAFDKLQKDKETEFEELKQKAHDDLRQLEDQLNARARQRIEDLEKKHKEELDGLSTEWTVERRSEPETMQPSSSEGRSVSPVLQQTGQLELQAQIAQGDVRQESPIYLKQRVKQLEAQIEALKDKQRKELELLVKGAVNPVASGPNNSVQAIMEHVDNHPKRDQRLASISLDNFGPGQLFAEPTEAEYLKNILFRYMTERESLGKESVTLAKAIAAVLKFSHDQTHTVVLKEEARSSSW